MSRILVVDDNEQIRSLLQRILVPEGHEVRAVHDGPTALAEVRRWAPDVVLLDAGRPGMSGFDVCRELKAHPATRLTPVVLLTALASVEDASRASGPADELLSKPVHTHELRARIRSLTRVKQLVDGLISDRPYRPALPHAPVVQHLRDEVDRGRFAPAHVEAFLDTPDLTTDL